MATFFGQSYVRAELLSYVGDISQIAGVTAAELSDGFERGVRIAEVRSGSGFDFTVLIDRGMDIGPASFRGAALGWRSPTTAKAAAFFDPEGLGWLRGFHGGLMASGGLTYFGAPSTDEGQALGLHGRASYTPATNFAYGGAWQGDEYEIWVSGELREASVFGENLVLQRRISTRLGGAHLVIEDTVTNEGYQAAPNMMLYHCNLGFPVVSPQSEFLAASEEVKPRDAAAQPGLGQHTSFQAPEAGYAEQVFYHRVRPDARGYAQAAVVNRWYGGGQGLGVYVRYRVAELPYLFQWKMMGQGHYVCGVEPASNLAEGRGKERREGRLVMLEPGQSRSYWVEVGVLASQAEIDAFAADAKTGR
jgi:hypothetical protein